MVLCFCDVNFFPLQRFPSVGGLEGASISSPSNSEIRPPHRAAFVDGHRDHVWVCAAMIRYTVVLVSLSLLAIFPRLCPPARSFNILWGSHWIRGLPPTRPSAATPQAFFRSCRCLLPLRHTSLANRRPQMLNFLPDATERPGVGFPPHA